MSDVNKEVKSESNDIWEEIKDVKIEIFALPGQVVHQHVSKLEGNSDKLVLKPKSPAVITSLEQAVGNKFNVELSEKYIIVTRR